MTVTTDTCQRQLALSQSLSMPTCPKVRGLSKACVGQSCRSMHAGKHLAIVDEGLAAVADTAYEAYRKVREKYPSEEPLLAFIPKADALILLPNTAFPMNLSPAGHSAPFLGPLSRPICALRLMGGFASRLMQIPGLISASCLRASAKCWA
ncbi:MAG: DUF5678 domain-containing protein [Candidatus Bipolaricaulia bacterium]